jgi:DNA end-binding protein Ku
MALRSNWEGFLRLNLVSIPVRAYTASTPHREKITFHQIHKTCNSRIRYQKICPIHGEVKKDEIVSGYEYAKGQYILVEPDELAKIRTENEKTIDIQTFIHPGALDPVYFTERSLYLVPSGKVAQKPFSVFHRVMEKENRQAIATIVLSKRDQLVLIRPIESLLVMTVLSYDNQIKKPGSFEDEVHEVKMTDKEVDLARDLVKAATSEKFDYSAYEDPYARRLKDLIETKAAGKKIVAPPEAEAPPVINLMEALRKSLAAQEKRPSILAGIATADMPDGRRRDRLAVHSGLGLLLCELSPCQSTR